MTQTPFSPLIAITPNANLISMGGGLLELRAGAVLTSSATPLVTITGPGEVNVATNLIRILDNGTYATLSGALASVSGGALTTGNNFLRIGDGAQVRGPWGLPLITFDNSSFVGGGGPSTNTGGALLRMFSAVGMPGSILEVDGPLLSAVNSSFSTTDASFINVRDGATLVTTGTSAVLVELTGSSVSSNGTVFRFGPDGTNSLGNTGSRGPVGVGLTEPLLSATDTSFSSTTGGFIGMRNDVGFSYDGSDPLVQLVGNLTTPSITTNSNFLYLAAGTGETPPSMWLGGGLLSATRVNISSGIQSGPSANTDSFLFVGDGATLRSGNVSPSPLVSLNQSTVNTAGDFLTIRRSPSVSFRSSVFLAGPLGTFTDSSTFTSTTTASTPCCGFLWLGENGRLVSTGAASLLQFSNSTLSTDASFVSLNIGGSQAPAGPSYMELSGPLLADNGSNWFLLGGNLLAVGNGSWLYGYTDTTLLSFSDYTEVRTGATNSLISIYGDSGNPGSSVVLAGPLLATSGSDGYATLKTDRSLLSVYGGSTLSSTTDSPLITLAGRSGSTDPVLQGLSAATVLAPIIDVGDSAQARPPDTGGVANLGMSGKGGLLTLDSALLSATAPIISALNSLINVNGDSANADPTGDAAGAIQLYRSSVTAAQVVSLDNSTLRVNNGPLLSVTGGRTVTISGDFASLTNGSRLFVNNGPLIYVNGAGSVLNVSGALVTFGTASGNQVIVNNLIGPTTTQSTIPVNMGTGGVVTIGLNPIKNRSSNTVSIIGSAIKAANFGTVNITAP